MRALLVVFALFVVGAIVVPQMAQAQVDDFTIHLADDADADGVLIELADTDVDSDSGDEGEDLTVTTPMSADLAEYFLVIPNPQREDPWAPTIVGIVEPAASSTALTVVLWEDSDEDGLYGETSDSVLDTDTTDASGQFELDLPNNFDGKAGVLILLDGAFGNGEDVTVCVGCTS